MRFNHTRVARTGVVDTYPNKLTAFKRFLSMAATICLGPGLPLAISSLECKTRFGLVIKGETSIEAGVWGHLVV